MRLNAEFDKRVVIRPDDYTWVASPANGVRRMMLDRVGDEVARATTIVQFEPDSWFDAHAHGGGEEFLVLEGTFSDETGDYPAGTYVRNPIGTSHTPHTVDGCTIFVKLHQFAPDDDRQFHLDTKQAEFEAGLFPGQSVLPLHSAPDEDVRLERLQPGTALPSESHEGGAEILVLEGSFEDEFGAYPKGTWIRLPKGATHSPGSQSGCLLYIKSGHLAAPDLARWTATEA
ncbi:MAG: cupin domain-containing protein [Pseudomonadota bacterium]